MTLILQKWTLTHGEFKCKKRKQIQAHFHYQREFNIFIRDNSRRCWHIFTPVKSTQAVCVSVDPRLHHLVFMFSFFFIDLRLLFVLYIKVRKTRPYFSVVQFWLAGVVLTTHQALLGVRIPSRHV